MTTQAPNALASAGISDSYLTAPEGSALWTRKPPAAADDKLPVQTRSGQGVLIKGELWNISNKKWRYCVGNVSN